MPSVKFSLGRLCIALPLAAFALVLADHVGSTPLHRGALWQVVRTCAIAAQTVGVPFPCEQVTLASDDAPGSAIIKSPLYKSEFLLMPLEAAAGVESPAVRGNDSSLLWQRAWETRSMVEARLGRDLPRTSVALVVNSGIARSQDQFHIHVDCVAPSVERKLALYGPKEEGRWQLFRQTLMGQRYWVKAVDKPEPRYHQRHRPHRRRPAQGSRRHVPRQCRGRRRRSRGRPAGLLHPGQLGQGGGRAPDGSQLRDGVKAVSRPARPPGDGMVSTSSS